MESSLPDFSAWTVEDFEEFLQRTDPNTPATWTLDDVLAATSTDGSDRQERPDRFYLDENLVWTFGSMLKGSARRTFDTLPQCEVTVTWQVGKIGSVHSGYDMSKLSGLLADMCRWRQNQQNEQVEANGESQISQGVRLICTLQGIRSR